MSTATPTLAQTLLPNRTITRDLALIGGGVALTALAAQVRIAWQPVPFTLQTLVVMLVGLGAGSRLGFLTLLTYVGIGVAGAPVFEGLAHGPSQLTGVTGGYLVGFIATATLLGWMSDRGYTKSVLGSALALAAGSLLTLVLGTLWLGTHIGLQNAVKAGFLPFIGIEAAKAAIAIPILPSAWRFLKSHPR